MTERRSGILTYPFDGLVESLYTPVEDKFDFGLWEKMLEEKGK